MAINSATKIGEQIKRLHQHLSTTTFKITRNNGIYVEIRVRLISRSKKMAQALPTIFPKSQLLGPQLRASPLAQRYCFPSQLQLEQPESAFAVAGGHRHW